MWIMDPRWRITLSITGRFVKEIKQWIHTSIVTEAFKCPHIDLVTTYDAGFDISWIRDGISRNP